MCRLVYQNVVHRLANLRILLANAFHSKIRSTIFVFDPVVSLSQNVIQEYQMFLTGIRHAMVADNNDFHDMRQVARHDGVVNILDK